MAWTKKKSSSRAVSLHGCLTACGLPTKTSHMKNKSVEHMEKLSKGVDGIVKPTMCGEPEFPGQKEGGSVVLSVYMAVLRRVGSREEHIL